MPQHPVKQLASQAAEAASGLAEFLDPLRDFNHPGVTWPRDLTKGESTALLPQLRAALGDLGTCLEGIAAEPGSEGTPRDRLNEAGRLMMQAFLKIQEAESALASPGDQSQAQPELAARSFPAARHHLPGTPVASPPSPGGPDSAQRRAGPGSRLRSPRTP
jgi:hypothetical protein